MNNICKLSEWDVMSISNDGEAVMASVLDGDLIIAKARSFAKVADMKKVRSAYLDALRRETDIGDLLIDESVMINGCIWSVHFIQISQGDVGCIIYADACIGDDVDVLEVQFSSLEQYLRFKPDLTRLIGAINFHDLRREYGSIEYLGVEVKAIAVSNLVYGGSNTENTMFFTGKNRYITVCISDKSQESILQKELAKNNLERVMCKKIDGIDYTRYCIHGKDGSVSGVLEFGTVNENGICVEVFGYSKNESDTFIVNDINLAIGGASSDDEKKATM